MQTIDIEKVNRNNFKALSNTLSMPGNVENISALYDSSLKALANTLLYSQVSFYYEGKEDFSLIKAITNAKESSKEKADYIFCDEINENLFKSAKSGTSKDPEFSCTFIFKCKDFKKTKVSLSGPGIKDKKVVNLPVDDSFLKVFMNKNKHYPLGNEVFFLNEKNEVLALSRTTKVEVL